MGSSVVDMGEDSVGVELGERTVYIQRCDVYYTNVAINSLIVEESAQTLLRPSITI